MELIRDICSECDLLLPIVNKKYYLCDGCNFKRTHGGRSKEDVYRERAKNKPKKIGRDFIDKQNKKKYNKIKNISNENHYRCSDGTTVSKAEMKFKLAITTDKIRETRLPVCEGTGSTNFPLSFSHTISVKRCQELGKAELSWDPDNIEIEGFHEPSSNPIAAHNIWESGLIEKKMSLLNFERKLAYIKIHDEETYNKLINKVQEYEQSRRDRQAEIDR